jgi:hypothetical protein
MINATDFLYMGVAKGATSIFDLGYYEFLHHPMSYAVNTDWANQFPDGTNYKYSDTNADNVIDSMDFYIYEYFFPCNNNLPSPINLCDSTLPTFNFVPSTDTIHSNDTLRFYLIAGSAVPVDSIFGIALTGIFPFTPLDNGHPEIISAGLYNSGLGNLTDLTLESRTKPPIVDLVVMRNDHLNSYNITADTLAYLDLIMDSTIHQDTLIQFQTTMVTLVSSDGTELPVSLCSQPVYQIYVNPLSVIESNLSAINIYPNPANNKITIDNIGSQEKEISFLNIIGKKVKSITTSSNSLIIDASSVAEGLYFILIKDENNQLMKKIIIER